MSGIERAPRTLRRHESVPHDAMVQKDAQHSIGARSARKMEQLAAACVAEGAAPVIVPEGNAYKWGRWYPRDLVEAMRAKIAQEEHLREGEEFTKEDIARLLSMPIQQVMDRVVQVKKNPKMAEHVRTARNRRGFESEVYDHVFVEAIRRAEAVTRAEVRAPIVKARLREVVLPPAVSEEEMLPHERTVLAKNDEALMTALDDVKKASARYRAFIQSGRVRDVREKNTMMNELEKVEYYVKEYQEESRIKSADELRRKITGLQNVLRKIQDVLRQHGVFDEK